MLILFHSLPDNSLASLSMGFLQSFLILSFTSLFANILGFLPLQLGGREGGFALSVSALGMTSALGLFISIICRVRELFWAVIGLALMKVEVKKEVKKEVKEEVKEDESVSSTSDSELTPNLTSTLTPN